MPSPWAGLLFLHGYLSDWRLARRLADRATPDRPVVGATSAPTTPLGAGRKGGPGRRVCQGIGDSDMRHQ